MGYGQSSGRGGAVNPGLPVQPLNPKGSDGDTYLWNEAINRVLGAPMRNDGRDGPPPSSWEDSGPTVSSNGGGLRAGHVSGGGNGKSSKERCLSGIEGIDTSELPDVPDGYWQPAEKAASGAPGDGVRNRSGVLEADGSDLDQIVSTGLAVLREIMDIPTPDAMDENYTKIVSIKKDAAVSAITAGLKADENRFRKRNSDVLAKMFLAIKGEKSSDPEGPLLEARVVN